MIKSVLSLPLVCPWGHDIRVVTMSEPTAASESPSTDLRVAKSPVDVCVKNGHAYACSKWRDIVNRTTRRLSLLRKLQTSILIISELNRGPCPSASNAREMTVARRAGCPEYCWGMCRSCCVLAILCHLSRYVTRL